MGLMTASLGLACALLLAGLLVGRRRRGRAPVPRTKRRELLPGGLPMPDDLEQDAYTDDQRYLM
jgi:hypothetical protein